jgi:hypothetical protein
VSSLAGVAVVVVGVLSDDVEEEPGGEVAFDDVADLARDSAGWGFGERVLRVDREVVAVTVGGEEGADVVAEDFFLGFELRFYAIGDPVDVVGEVVVFWWLEIPGAWSDQVFDGVEEDFLGE